VRVISWNIEQGKRWKQLLECFDRNEFRTADIICLNEADEGMARSGNRRVAAELAGYLGLHDVFGPAWREWTRGIGEERPASGENAAGLVLESRNIALPVCHDPSNDDEKREGGRCAIVARLDCGEGQSLLVANTHLEVLTTTECRREQMAFLLRQLDTDPVVLAGDWNTNTFDRGNAWRTVRSALRLIRPNLGDDLLNPVPYEPLFEELRRAGFVWEGFNDSLPTCVADLRSLEDRRYLPAAVRNYVLRRVQQLPLRLDWIAGRGIRAIRPGRTLVDLPLASDHLPIMCDVE
jgi:endonuclease/exonuclease/phosphatase family metal-dependent hydrolase